MTIRSQYKHSLKRPEAEELLDLWIYRPIAFAITQLIVRTSITPNQITAAAVVASVLPFTALPDTKRRMPAGMLVNRAARRVPESATPAIPVSAVPVLVAPVLTKPDSELYTWPGILAS